MENGKVLYGFGVYARGAPVSIDDPDVFAVQHEDLAALVAPMLRSEFDEERQTLEWLSRHITRHDAVLAQAMRSTTVIPWRFCALFEDEGGVERILAAHAEEFRSLLVTLADREEWTVTAVCSDASALLERVRTSVSEVRELIRRERAAGAGAAYLIARKREQREREEVQGELRAVAEAGMARLGEMAQLVVLEPKAGEVHRVAALVRVPDRAKFSETITKLGEGGVQWSTQGPYPPYSFVGGA